MVDIMAIRTLQVMNLTVDRLGLINDASGTAMGAVLVQTTNNGKF